MSDHHSHYRQMALSLCHSSDFWALGCIIYQMIAGRFAFQGLSEYLTWQKIKQLDYSFPEGFDEQAKDLVQKLLVRPFSSLLWAHTCSTGLRGCRSAIQRNAWGLAHPGVALTCRRYVRTLFSGR